MVGEASGKRERAGCSDESEFAWAEIWKGSKIELLEGACELSLCRWVLLEVARRMHLGECC